MMVKQVLTTAVAPTGHGSSMTLRTLTTLAILATACLAGCGRAPGLAAPGEGELAGSGQALFSALDVDGDGRLSRVEAGLPGFAFDRLDRNGDDALGFVEWSESRPDAAQAWQTQLRSEAQRDLATGSAVRGEN